MKKLALYLVAAISTLSCSNAQIKEFSKETMQKELVLPDNNKVTFKDLLKKHKGKVTVIEVWASWCSDCVKAMPKVKEMQANHTNVDFVFISMDKAYDKWLTSPPLKKTGCISCERKKSLAQSTQTAKL